MSVFFKNGTSSQTPNFGTVMRLVNGVEDINTAIKGPSESIIKEFLNAYAKGDVDANLADFKNGTVFENAKLKDERTLYQKTGILKFEQFTLLKLYKENNRYFIEIVGDWTGKQLKVSPISNDYTWVIPSVYFEDAAQAAAAAKAAADKDAADKAAAAQAAAGDIQSALTQLQKDVNSLLTHVGPQSTFNPDAILEIWRKLLRMQESLSDSASKNDLQLLFSALAQIQATVESFSTTLQIAQASVPDNVLSDIATIKTNLEYLTAKIQNFQPVPGGTPSPPVGPATGLLFPPSPPPPVRPASNPPDRDECCEDLLKMKEAELAKLEAEFARLQAVREDHQNKYFEMLKKEFE